MSEREGFAARVREVEVPGVVLMTKGLYAGCIAVTFIAGIFLGWLIWGAP